jgi:hypothetical protein
MDTWRCRLWKRGKLDFLAECGKWQTYVADYCAGPQMWSRQQKAGEARGEPRHREERPGQRAPSPDSAIADQQAQKHAPLEHASDQQDAFTFDLPFPARPHAQGPLAWRPAHR